MGASAMESKRLSKHQSLVVQLLCGGLFTALLGVALIFLFSAGASAAANAATGVGTQLQVQQANPAVDLCTKKLEKEGNYTMAKLRVCASISNGKEPCADALAAVATAADVLNSACRSMSTSVCKEKMDTCKGQDDSATDENLDTANPCSSVSDILSTECKSVNGGNSRDYQEAKTDSQKNLTEAQKQLMEATKKQQEAANQTKQKISNLQADIQAQALALDSFQKKTQQALAAQLLKDSAEKAKAVTDAMAKLAAINAQELALNTETKAAVAAISKANDDKLAKCRDWAETAYNKDLEALKIKIQARDSVIRNLGSATTIAPYTTTQAKNDETEKNKSYTSHYMNCINSIEGGGADSSAAIKAAQKALDIMNTDHAVKIKGFADQRIILNKALADASALLTEQDRQATVAAQNDIDTQQKSTTLKVNKDNADIAQLTQQLQQSQQTDQQEIQLAQQNIANASAELQTASVRSSCFQKFGVSESRAKTATDNWNKVPSSLQAMISQCKKLKNPENECGEDSNEACDTYASRTSRRSGPPKDTGSAK